MIIRPLGCALAALLATSVAASAADRYFAYNLTTRTEFSELYLAPAGTQDWGRNQTLNDKDKSLETSERLPITGLGPGRYDVKLVDKKGRICIKKDVELGQERSFEIHDSDIAGCR